MTPDMLLACAVAALAGLMRGFAGFGSGMLMAPLFAILFGPVATVAMIVSLELVVTVQLLPRVLNQVQWRFVLLLGGVATLFMPVGSSILATVDPELLSRVMAAIVILFVLVLLTGWRYQGEKKPLPTLAVGAVSGTLMAATSMGNPPVLLYMFSGRDDAVTNRANIIAYFAVTQGILLLVMLFMGLLSWGSLLKAGILLPGFLLAAWVGSRLFRASSETLYRRVALAFLFCAGLYGLLR